MFYFYTAIFEKLKYRTLCANLLLIDITRNFSGLCEYFLGWDTTLRTLNGSIICSKTNK